MAEGREARRMTAVVARTALCVLTGLCLASGQWAGARAAAAQQCADDDECTVQYSCQDGLCKGTPKQDGTACRLDDPCGTFSCQQGSCVPSATSPPGTVCQELPEPFPSWTCQELPAPIYVICQPPPRDCDDGNACTADFFLPAFGECGHIPIDCNTDCSTADCNPQTGCDNPQFTNEGGACDDGNVCTSNDRCQAGVCVAGSVVVTPTGVPTEDETESPTPTRSQTPTPSRTATATAPTSTTPQTPAPCGTDCGGDGDVTVDDIVRLVNNTCPALPNRTQADLILSLDGALGTCAEELPTPTTTATQSATASATASLTPSTSPSVAISTPTPSPSATTSATGTATGTPTTTVSASPGTTATPTATGSVTATVTDTPSTPVIPNVPERAAGTVEASQDVFLAISRVFGLVVGLAGGGGAGSGASTQAPSAACEDGGELSAELTNILECFLGSAPIFQVTMTDCKLTSAGVTLMGNGSLTITGSAGNSCFEIPQQSTLDVPSVTLEASATTGTTTLTVTGLTAQLNLLDPVEPCNYETFLLQQLQGTVAIVTRDANDTESSSTVTFSDADLRIDVTQYNALCVPLIFTTTVNGGVEITAGNLTPFTGQFKPYVISDDATSGQDVTRVSGVVESVCLGGSAELVTVADQPLVTAIGQPCPQAGAIEVKLHGNTDRITYTALGGVDIDVGNNGGEPDEHFDSCLQLSPCS